METEDTPPTGETVITRGGKPIAAIAPMTDEEILALAKYARENGGAFPPEYEARLIPVEKTAMYPAFEAGRVPARHLDAAAEGVRSFNHGSLDIRQGWEWAPASYRAIGALSYLTDRLHQAISQATGPAVHAAEQSRLTIDGGGDPKAALGELLECQSEALAAAEALAQALRKMHSAASPMGTDTTGLYDDDQEEGRG